MKDRTCLIDGDIIAYRCGFASEHKKYTLTYTTVAFPEDELTEVFEGKRAMNSWIKEWDDELLEYEWTSELIVEPLEYCLSTVKHMVENIRVATKSKLVEVYLSDTHNFRERIATIQKYKGNRDDRRKPIHHTDVIKYLTNIHKAIVIDDMEADDVLAEVQTSRNEAGQDTVIASIDKDLLQIPGKHWNFVTDKGLLISKDTGDRNFCMQMLTGDTTDNIPGIKGIGPVGAKKLLEDCENIWQMRLVVRAAWHDYLSSDNIPEWVSEYDAESEVLRYSHWENDNCFLNVTLDDLLDELASLLYIGIPKEGEKSNV